MQETKHGCEKRHNHLHPFMMHKHLEGNIFGEPGTIQLC